MTILKDVKRAIIYEYITDTWPTNGNLDNLMNILRPLNPEMILRAYFRWTPMGERYSLLRNTITRIKSEFPDIIITGGIPAHRINYNPLDTNEITGEIITATEAWNIALDPAKWGFTNPTKDDIQIINRGKWFGVSSSNAWFPDISNARFRQFALSWAEKQIDAGIDSIWIDILWNQVRFFWELSNKNKNPYHQSVIDSIDGVYRLIDGIKDIGIRKGKTITVGSWLPIYDLPLTNDAFQHYDYVTIHPGPKNTLSNIFATDWTDKKNAWKQLWGDIPIFAFLDWGGKLSPMQVFSQGLNTAEQNMVLTKFGQEFPKAGFIFAYPVHGADTLNSTKRQAYGLYDKYDALAPEFKTYNTIKNLINQIPPSQPLEPPQPSEFGINKFLMVGLAAGLLYTILKKVVSKNKK